MRAPLLLLLTPLLTPIAAAEPPQQWPPQWPGGYWYAPHPYPMLQPAPPVPVERPPTTTEQAHLSSPNRPATPRAKDPADGTEEQHQRALQAMQRGDYAVAYCIWNPLAEQGDGQAQFSLGWMYHNGYGLAIDNRRTLQLWSAAAQGGLVNAAFALGMLLSEGDHDIERDLPQAVEYYLQAAHQGHEDAKVMLLQLLEDEPRALQPIVADWRPEAWQLLGKRITIRVERANARKRPTLDSRVLQVLERDAELVWIGERQEWLRGVVPEQGLLVWVHRSLVELPTPQDQSEGGK